MKITVTLHANGITWAIYKNKVESSETPTRKGTVSVNCSVYCLSNDDRTRSLPSRRNISSDGASQSWIAADRLFSAHFQSFAVPWHEKPKVQDQ